MDLKTLLKNKKVDFVLTALCCVIADLLLRGLLYSIVQQPSVSALILVLTIPIIWKYGRNGGLIALPFFLINSAVIYNDFDFNNVISALFTKDPLISGIIFIIMTFVSSEVMKIIRRLQKEIAYRKQIEAELNEYKTHLEDMIKKRTDELQFANEYIKQAEKMEALGQLTGGIAHDFKNILLGINGYTSMIKKKTADDPMLQKYANGILNASEQASKLIGNMLSFARKSDHEFKEIDMHKIVGDVVSLLEHSLDKNIKINMNFNAEKFVVIGDSSQIQNVFLNMGLNARDAMPNGGQLTYESVSADFSEDCNEVKLEKLLPGSYIILSVTDTGTGMPEQVKKKIFEPFFTTKEKGKGTGMGLATSYTNIVNHKGKIDLISEEGMGTTFKIYLPLYIKTERKTAPSTVSVAEKPESQRALVCSN
jgi:signal transduction histidine kinase